MLLLVVLDRRRTDRRDGPDRSGHRIPDGRRPRRRRPGLPADTERFTRFDGSPLKLSDFRGQKLVVNFFASTCVPCKKEMPALQAVHERLGDDVTFIGIAVQDDPEAAQELIDQTGVSYDLGQDPTGSLFQRLRRRSSCRPPPSWPRTAP